MEGRFMASKIIVSAGVPMCSSPVQSPESVLSRIAARAVGGKVAIVERGAKKPMVVTLHPDADAATCETIDVEPDEEQEEEQE
jgi:hypothetical protein